MFNKIVKSNIMMKIATIILCLVIISTHFTSGLYSRYTAKDTSADNARVAEWDVAAEGGKPALTIDCTTTDLDDEYKITVSNGSEVAVKYDIIVSFTEKLPDSITVKLNGNPADIVSSDGKKLTFSNMGQMNVGAASKEYVLAFTADADNILEDSSYDFKATVAFEQID